MKRVESSSDEAKLLEEKRKEMNNLIGLNNISVKGLTLLINDWCKTQIKILHKEYPNTEWLAVCKVEPQGNGTFLMTDMVFPGQKGVGGEVETTEKGMEWLNKELIKRGENGKLWNCILHSHHHMGCFWSGTDDNARLSLNDGRQLAWAVVTAYNDKGVDYKGCLNFYKPYNIEIDAEVKDESDTGLVERYNEYEKKVEESEASFYEYLLETNKEYIDSITEKPTYSRVLEYLGLDITAELEKNYNEIKDKVGNPELIAYMKQLENKARELAVAEVNTGGIYSDMLAEYGAFCDWSDNLLTQLERAREKEYTLGSYTSPSLLSSTAYPLNRDFEYEYDDYDNYDKVDFYFTAPDYDEYYVRQIFGIDENTPMKVGKDKEWLVWSGISGDYLYVEDWAEEFWG